jgi:hypothetical protein
MRSPSTWQPILEGELAARARRAIAELARALPAHLDASTELSLGLGRPGGALFHAYHGAARGDADEVAYAHAVLERCGDTLADAVLPPGLYDGFTGLAWVTAHLGDTAALADLDACLHALPDHAVASFDLIRGLTGLGVYALERGDRGLLAQVVARLAARAVPTPDGPAWFTPPAQMGEWKLRLYPRGCHDLGMAHGAPAVIALLAGAVAHGIAQAGPLLAGAVGWLRAQRLAAGGYGEVAGARAPTRLAWCYGDLGVASALLLASEVGDPAWRTEAIALAVAAARRPADRVGVVDAGLCHGAAGLAHQFNRLYQATGVAELRAAACAWIDRALALRGDHGIAGFASHDPDPADRARVTWVADPGFLQGAAGIGLALLAADTALEPTWDRALLLSLPIAAQCR